MKRTILAVTAAVLGICSITSHAQTTYTGVVSAFNCGRISNINCYGIPMLVNDGTDLVNETIWIDDGPASDSVVFPTDPLGLDNVNGIARITSPLQHLNLNSGVQTITFTFAGHDSNQAAYTGTLTLNYTTYYSSGGGGRGGAPAGYRWIVTGGSITITFQQ